MDPLVQIMRDWVDRSSQNSLYRLAKKSGVSYCSVRRIIQGEQNPSMATKMAIATAICDPDKVKTLFSDRVSQVFMSEKEKSIPDVREAFLRDSLTHEIMCFATPQASVNDIKEEFGEKGMRIVDELVGCGAMKRELSTVLVDSVQMTAVNDLIRAVQLSAQGVQSKDLHGLAWLVHGWSDLAVKLLKQDVALLLEKVFRMRDDERYRGTKSCNFGVFLVEKGGKE